MKKKLVLIGASGLVGKSIIRQINDPQGFYRIMAYIRHPHPEIKKHPIVKSYIFNFRELLTQSKDIDAHTLVCSFGSTLKKAGSKKEFRNIDLHIPSRFIEMAARKNLKHLILISAVGASSKSKFFYNRVKGELEDFIQTLGIDRIDIVRPSLLTGQRRDYRLKEELGKKLFLAFDFLFPHKYKAVSADHVAQKVIDLINSEEKGVFIHEGKAILPQ